VDDRVHAAQALVDGRAVANVPDDELDVIRKVSGARPALVNLRIEVVEDPDAVPAPQQLVADMGSDKAGPPRNQHMHRLTLFLF
jgi:hypothetical protein